MTVHVGGVVENNLESRHKQQAVAHLSEARARLEGEIGKAIALGNGLRSLIVDRDGLPLDQDLFNRVGAELLDGNSVIKLIAVAPDNILSLIYPLVGNEGAIGLNYRLNAEQWPSIREAMIRRSEVIVGPVNLVQGGQALLVRIPIYPPAFAAQPLAERRYWGVATVAIDQSELIVASGMKESLGDYQVEILSYSENGTQAIYGGIELSEQDVVSLPVHFPGTTEWEVLAYPENGWQTTGGNLWLTWLSGATATLIFAGMAFLLILEVYKVRRMALHDDLTGLANRRLLEERMKQLAAMCDRSGEGFEIFFVDLNGFKPVNDNYGHAVGDQLLVEVGQRLTRQVRLSDTVSRVGGDEFIVLTTGTMSRDERDAFVERLEERLSRTFVFAGAAIEIDASIGHAAFPDDASTIEDLLRVADARMYSNKVHHGASITPLEVPPASVAG
ncbi:diguanylate cyclase (GGDEF)-like protein [Roseibium hamelinense]|uniref:Diguanylate cyclase (GGDEF)-like protein n=1 Tax=Roseibium hamelinense TaxID=150831 RepID=A0A562T0Y8_9HYPH|nr:diguanylate cyclase [Roseibium hamelinense]TWI87275.1 diguanylate cyclase (GGDEF)-like protein [Roseibium hamelinense]